jgi:hypothetical protein
LKRKNFREKNLQRYMPWIENAFSILTHGDSKLKKWAEKELDGKTQEELLALYLEARAEAQLVQELNVEVSKNHLCSSQDRLSNR